MKAIGPTSPYQAAVDYINLGLAVFPIKYKDKTPLTKNGCKDATTDAAKIKAWWQKWPNANVGIATGKKSGGLFVIDLDIDEEKGINGYQTMQDWQRQNGILPETWLSITGRGGYHMFFQSNNTINNRAGILDGVDIRGEGGYVVAPPSLHPNGNYYEWEQEPGEYVLSEADTIVHKFLDERRQKQQGGFKVPEVIGSGKRNATMYKFCCSLQAKGVSDVAIIAAVKAENEARCVPPLEDKELENTINSALKYDKGTPVVIRQEEVLELGEHTKPDLEYGEKGILQTIDNICKAIEYDPCLRGKIKYNILSYSPFVYGVLPWERKDTYREWNNSDDSNLKCYIEAKYGLKSMEKIMEALTIVVGRNPFNPVLEYLEQIQWDGKNHIEDLLPNYLGVEKNEYSIECMKLFMLGAITRAYHPGCKFDYMPVLVGEQGIGKSTFFKILAGNDNWYNDNFNNVEGDKATEKLRGMWMVELAELLAAKKAKEVESIKAFITSTVDTYRPPYGRRTEQRPRVCVFAGTTNNDHFLTDRTGNRRYLPLIVNKAMVRKSMFDNRHEVMEDFRQAWGEALQIYRTQKPKLDLPDHLKKEVAKIQGHYMEEDVRVGIIQEWLDSTNESYVCVVMLWELAIGYDYKPSRRESNEIHDIMQHSIEGWERITNEHGGRKKLKKYGTQICYTKIRNTFSTLPEKIQSPFD